MLVFDRPKYFDTLGWLGTQRHFAAGSAIERPVSNHFNDLRGSWPYQSLPPKSFFSSLIADGRWLSWTAVIKPNSCKTTLQSVLSTLDKQFNASCVPLKNHLCHRADQPCARENYSRRTRQRIDIAKKHFFCQRETFNTNHLQIYTWQERVRLLRKIPHISSPTANHFEALIRLAPEIQDSIAVISLRRQDNKALSGILIAMFDESGQSWHCHSCLTDKLSLKMFGTFLLYDSAVALLQKNDIWFGGAPSGPNGSGVFTFKERFSNFSAPAHLVSLDLNKENLLSVRRNLGKFPFLPNYRDPSAEMALRSDCD